jgi:glycosyltransferase involved in cell wall biosynthesis
LKNILIITTSDSGGAGLYNQEFLTALIKCGYNVKMLVAKKSSPDDNIVCVKRTFYQRFMNKFGIYLPWTLKYKSKKIWRSSDKNYIFLEIFEQKTSYTFNQIKKHIKVKPDLIISCWTSGFLNYDLLGKLSQYFNAKPYVYMADMSPITGGCHYAWDCDGYKNNCKYCPALSPKYSYIASRNLLIKNISINKYNISILSASTYTQFQARESFLFNIKNEIPFYKGYIDTDVFNSNNREIVRNDYNIAKNTTVILLGALNLYEKRKGFKQLVEALNTLSIKNSSILENVLLIAIGDHTPFNCSINIRFLPYTKSKTKLAEYYQLADIYANSSLQDSGPQMLLQAMACGAIPVSFDVGFGADIINGKTGFKATVGNIEKYADALKSAIKLSLFEREKIKKNITVLLQKENSLLALKTFIDNL